MSVLFVLLFLCTVPMMAADGTAAGPVDLKPLMPMAMAVASGLCALGQGKAVAAACESIARNPGATAAIRFALILGLVLIESLALYVLILLLK